MSRHTFTRLIAWPAALAFGAVVRLRAWLYRKGVLHQQRLSGPVISIGNLTTGGTGKTPMTIWLAQRLMAEGKRAGILTRGYRSWPAGSAAANRNRTPASDEVLVLRSHLGDEFPIGIGADRIGQGRRLASDGVDWVLLDDGFQHLQVARDVDIVLMDATNPLGDNRLLPAGRLREPACALARADIVVITRAAQGAASGVEPIVRRYTRAPIFYAQPKLLGIFRIHPEPVGPSDLTVIKQEVFAFCATGNPDAFFDDLRRWGMNVVGEWAFRDHHVYSQRNVDDLQRVAREERAAALVCTEKDIPNFRNVRFDALPVHVCRISMQPAQPDEFWQAVRTTAERRRPK